MRMAAITKTLPTMVTRTMRPRMTEVATTAAMFWWLLLEEEEVSLPTEDRFPVKTAYSTEGRKSASKEDMALEKRERKE